MTLKDFGRLAPVLFVLIAIPLTDLGFEQSLLFDQYAAPASPWILYGDGPIMSASLPSEAANNIYAPDVHKEAGVWKMWYGGQDASGHDSIHYATSADGITWEKHGVVLDNAGYAGSQPILDNDPSVVQVGGTYYMYYTENAGRDRILLATSTNGITWNRQGIVLDLTPGAWGAAWTSRPSILYADGTFKLWYDALDSNGLLGVGYATSTDGLHFTKSPANPVLRNTVGAVDVKHVGRQYVMVYQGTDHHIDWATSPDETHFTSQGQLLPLTGGSSDAYGQVTPMIYLDEQGNWTRTYYGGASDSCWCKNSIALAYNANYPVAGEKQVVIQGYKLVSGGSDLARVASDPVSFDGVAQTTANPYFIYQTLYHGTTHTVSVAPLAGYAMGFTMCVNVTTCHTAPAVAGASVTLSADALPPEGFVDLWWHYRPLPSPLPSPLPPPPASPTPSSMPRPAVTTPPPAVLTTLPSSSATLHHGSEDRVLLIDANGAPLAGASMLLANGTTAQTDHTGHVLLPAGSQLRQVQLGTLTIGAPLQTAPGKSYTIQLDTKAGRLVRVLSYPSINLTLLGVLGALCLLFVGGSLLAAVLSVHLPSLLPAPPGEARGRWWD